MRPAAAARGAKAAAWLQACGLLFALGGMALAEGAAAWNLAAQTLDKAGSGLVGLGLAAYWAAAGTGLASLRWIQRRAGPRGFLWSALGLAMLIQLAAIAAADPQWEWTGDSRIFQQYLDRLAEGGYSAETLGDLSRHYDYPIWTRRALPFYYGLRLLSGAHFVRTVQVFQALLVVLSLALTARIARRLFGRKVAFWAVALQLLMPFRWFICLDLNHYLAGGLYFTATLWALVEWDHQPRGGGRKWSLALLLALLLPLMRLEGGLDRLYLVGALLVLLFQRAAGRRDARQTLVAAAAWLAGPWLAGQLLLAPVSARIDQADAQRLSSGAAGFIARGWMPDTGGEYAAVYEQLDWLTPAAEKVSMQTSLLASQALYNPRPLLFRLLPSKLAKYFLLGYASGAEEMLLRNGAEKAAQLAKGARTAYLLAALPWMIWGGLLWLPLLRRTRRIAWTVPALAYVAATILVGETSPRYSFHVQPLLFILGALPLAWSARRRAFLLRAARRPTAAAAISGGVALLLAAGLLVAGRPWLRNHAVLDLREWRASPAPRRLPAAATRTPFEIHLAAEPGTTSWGTLEWPPGRAPASELSFYLLPLAGLSASRDTPALLRRETAQGRIEQPLVLPARITLALAPGDAPSFEILSVSSPPPFPLAVGYARFRAPQNAP